MTSHSQPRLIEGLRNWSEGFSPDVAAVELLIGHESWLTREDFLSQCVDCVPQEELFDPERPVTLIDWDAVTHHLRSHTFPASSSAIAILSIAASLGTGYQVDLRGSLLGLDQTNSDLVIAAITTVTTN